LLERNFYRAIAARSKEALIRPGLGKYYAAVYSNLAFGAHEPGRPGKEENRLKLCDSPEFLLDLRHTDMDSPAALVPVRNFYQSQ
jgi:hypothetical protein